MNHCVDVPLFPLPVVLFPGCRMPLQIFEPRYIDLVKSSLSTGAPFGIVTLSGDPAQQVVQKNSTDTAPSAAPECLPIGTLATIVDFDQRANGLLGIVVEGVSCIRVESSRVADNHLVVGSAEPYPCPVVGEAAQRFNAEQASVPVPDDYAELVDVFLSLVAHPYVAQLGYEHEPDADYWRADAERLGCHLAYLLPSTIEDRYALLCESDVMSRLARIESQLATLSDEP